MPIKAAQLTATAPRQPTNHAAGIPRRGGAGLARCTNGFVQSVTTQGEAAYLAIADLEAGVPRYGDVAYDVVFSGGFYALIDAQALD